MSGAESAGNGEAVPGKSGYLRFDALTQIDWSAEVVAKLDRWNQGDLIPGSPLLWAGPAGPDLVLGTKGEGPAWEAVDEGTLGGGWSMVTSQTCDIAGTGPGRVQPFVDASPVFQMPEELTSEKADSIRAFGTTYLVALTSPPTTGLWVVDLRLSVPVSKGLLVEHDPVTPWANERDRLDLAEAIANRKRRAALHDALSSEFVDSLRAYIKNADRSEPEWWERVEQVRAPHHGRSTEAVQRVLDRV